MRRHTDWTVVTCRGVLEQTLVGPATAFVEPPGSRISRHHSEPGTRVLGIFDPSFCVRHEHVGHAFATMVCRNVELFDFVVDDHHKSSDLALDYGDRGVVHSLRSPSAERIFVTRLDQLLGYEPEVAVAPSEIPDLGNRRRVFRKCSAQRYLRARYHRRSATSAPLPVSATTTGPTLPRSRAAARRTRLSS